MTITETNNTPVGTYAPDFELPGIDGQVHHLGRYLEKFRAVGVILMCNHCPYVRLYVERLKNIQAEFGSQSFTLIGMNGSDATVETSESFENMKAFARFVNLNFPYLWDSTQEVTRSLGATQTPMAFLIDAYGVVRYKGQIDDNPQEPEAVQQHYLKGAIACLMQGQEILPKETEPVGTSLILRN
ncbi:MAG: thioredoxin family protein [Scytonema sp. PMC 1069.18]|nr:thioredoxin family protein [Scytonema sp. PMC 1069.18]MEC4886187.1 thioredoxin family protein [Scytonema sp. PMC 1070.18]